MNRLELLNKIESINIWKKDGQRAPHKPLLILYALGQLQSAGITDLSYNDIYEPLKKLLIDFGPSRKIYYPEQPFVRLSNDGIWCLDQEVSRSEIKQKWMRENNITGSFIPEILELFNEVPDLIFDVANHVLYRHFPESLHQEILEAVGLEFAEPHIEMKSGVRHFRPRDPKFRGRIMEAYNNACSVCGYDISIMKKAIGLEAAHIKWHQAGGPDIEQNGLALCNMHHILFDKGAFTLDSSHRIKVSSKVDSSLAADTWLYNYSGRNLRVPVNIHYIPSDNYLEWHVKEVFKGQ
jgi:putative restriction endonuclease